MAGAVFFLSLSGCATVRPIWDTAAESDRIAGSSFSKEIVPTSYFHLTAYSKLQDASAPLAVYIEGDGRAWYSRTELSSDPTPLHPIGLMLAVSDPGPNVVYLARPCQYSSLRTDPLCKDPAYWSDKRFSEEAVSSMDEAIDHFAKKASSGMLELNGYSGGGALAVLIAARRNDIETMRTVAGNLDLDAFSRHHRVSPMTGSLDPAAQALKIAGIPQRHFTGGKDTVMPSSIAESFFEASGKNPCIQITRVEEASHNEEWVSKWSELVRMPVSCPDKK